MTDRTRPLLLGYIREDCISEHHVPGCSDDPLTIAQHSLATYAHVEGFTLGTVYVEHPHTAPSAIHALAEHLDQQEDAWAVVIPEPEHVTDHEHHVLNSRSSDYATISVLVANLTTPHSPADLAPLMPLSAPGPPTTPASPPARTTRRTRGHGRTA